MIGLDPSGVRDRLGVPTDWAPAPLLLELQTPRGKLTVYWLDEGLIDPTMMLWTADFQARHQPAPLPAHRQCEAKAVRQGEASDAIQLDLLFLDGKLKSAYGYIPPPPGTRPHPAPSLTTIAKRPRPSAFVAHPGDLPLSDGDAFLSRWDKRRLEPGDHIEVTCEQMPARPLPSHTRGRSASADDISGFALIPFLPLLPFKNAQRSETKERGDALLASLQVGQPLGEPAERFVADHPGVRLMRGQEPDYVVLTVNRGALPSNALNNLDQTALIGVRAGTVTWIAPGRSGNLGLSKDLLCLDTQGIPGRVRAGCSDNGVYAP